MTIDELNGGVTPSACGGRTSMLAGQPAHPGMVGRDERAARADRAFALYCQGMRPAAIAAELGASVASVRRWLRASLRALADDIRDAARNEMGDAGDADDAGDATPEREAPADPTGQLAQVAQLMRAVESQRAIAHAAWDAYERERAVEDAILRGELDRVRRRAIRPAARDMTANAPTTNDRHGAHSSGRKPRLGRDERSVVPATTGELSSDGAVGPLASEADEQTGNIVLEEYERPRHTSQGARYLAVALAAQREVARLQGLYERIERALPGVHIILSRRPAGRENAPHAVDSQQPE